MGDILKEIGDIKLKQLLDKYNMRGHMYVEYPHKDVWSKEFNDDDYRKALQHLFSYKKKCSLTSVCPYSLLPETVPVLHMLFKSYQEL